MGSAVIIMLQKSNCKQTSTVEPFLSGQSCTYYQELILLTLDTTIHISVT